MKFEGFEPVKEGGITCGQAFNPARAEKVEVRVSIWRDSEEAKRFKDACDKGGLEELLVLDGPDDASLEDAVEEEDLCIPEKADMDISEEDYMDIPEEDEPIILG